MQKKQSGKGKFRSPIEGLNTTLVCIGMGAVTFVIYMILMARTDLRPLWTGMILGLLYLVSAGTYIFFIRKRAAKPTSDEKLNPVLSNIMLDTVIKLQSPVVICEDKQAVGKTGDRIIWYNRAASAVCGGESLYGKSLMESFGADIVKIMRDESSDGSPVNSSEHFWRAKGYRIKTAERNYCLIVFTDTTDLIRLYRKFGDEETAVAYIIVDNLDELLQYEQEKYRAAAGSIEQLLREWANEVGGILKEYERDKYLFVFRAAELDKLMVQKFDILDKIRDIRVGDGNLPVTISMGVAKTGDRLSDKEKAAASALDLALQRGGDQAVVKIDGNTEFFGGRTKAVQKRTRVRARVIANELIMHISRASNVIIMGHKYPDYDSVGACVGFARLAMFCGVPVNIVTGSGTGFDFCRKTLEHIPEYRDVFVDAASGLDLVRSDTLLIVTDVNNNALFESQDIYDKVFSVAIIDHHRKTAEFQTQPLLTYIEPSASSACELVTEMLEQTLPAGDLLREEAELLLAGILLDTKQFTKSTGVRTFSAALYLRDRGAAPSEVQGLFRDSMDNFLRMSKFETGVDIYRGCAAFAVKHEIGDQGDKIAAAKTADRLLTVDGVTASFALVVIDDAVHVSARSSGKLNVQLILERCGGGGHFDSAGAQIAGATTDAVVAQIKSIIDEVMAE